MLSLAYVFRLVPPLVFFWMVVGATLLFTSVNGGGRLRGWGVAFSVWGTLASESVARTPPLWVQLLGVAGLALSLVVFHWASVSIRGRLFSLAGCDDLPQFVHRSGPYAYIRNPFYASYLLAECSTVVMWPSIPGVVVVVLATAYFHWLVRFEEQKFLESPVAAEYATYKAATGRFLPRFTGGAA